MDALCRECGYAWDTYAKIPQCPKCKSKAVDVDEALESRIEYELVRLNKKVDRALELLKELVNFG